MQAAAARKREDRFHDHCAGLLQASLGVGEIIRIEDHQSAAARLDRAAGIAVAAESKAAGQATIVELTVARAVILERPAESAAIEVARACDVATENSI